MMTTKTSKVDDIVVSDDTISLANMLMRLYQKVDALEKKLELVESFEADKVELIEKNQEVNHKNLPKDKFDANQTIYTENKKFAFISNRLKYLTIELAKLQYQAGNHALYQDSISTISKPINKKLILVVCTDYPQKGSMYGGAFIVARVQAYQKAGYEVKVCVAKGAAKSDPTIDMQDGIEVHRGNEDLLAKMLLDYNPGCIVVHSPRTENYNIFKKYDVLNRLIFIFHGFEVRDMGHLWYNFDETFFSSRANGILQMDMNRKLLAIEVFQDPRIHKVFVSNFFKNLVSQDITVELRNAHVIPNLIEDDLFDYRAKNDEDRLNIFSVRPYDNNNYAADLIVETVLQLSKKPYFSQLKFHIQGFGKTFPAKTEILRKFENVKVCEGILTRPEISSLHKTHGIALIPTRFDTQGVSLGEAMSSGLVPVTNNCAAIPEFLNSEVAILAPKDDVETMVEGIERLYYHPELYRTMSQKAAKHVRQVAGPEKTVNEEIALIQKVLNTNK